MSFALGEVFGPLIGNYLYTKTDFAITCDLTGIALVVYAIVYFLACDVSLHNYDKRLQNDVEYDRL